MRVFFSSTYSDLKDVRERVESAVRTAGWDTRQMEFFGARPETPLSVSISEVRKADLVILVVGAEYRAYFGTTLDAAASFNHTYAIVGRTDELHQVKAFLSSDRMVCLVVGPGGTGKSKLLYEVARWQSESDNVSLPHLRFYRAGLS